MLKIKNVFVLLTVVLLVVGCSPEKPSDELLPTPTMFTILIFQQAAIDADASFLAKNDIVTVTTAPSMPATKIQVYAAKCKTLSAGEGMFRITCYENAFWRDYEFEWGIDYSNIVFDGYANVVYKNEQ